MTEKNAYIPYQNKLEEHFFEFLVEGITSEIFVCDTEGTIVYMNPYSEQLIQKDRSDLIGRNIRTILDEKVVSCSVTLEVLKTKKESRGIQKVEDSKELLAIGTPFYDANNQLQYVLTTTYDVGKLCSINSKLEEENKRLLLQMQSMSFYKEQFFEDSGHIFAGEAMEAIVNTVIRTASLDSPVLISGETGVGKESVAKMIHRLRHKEDGAFVKINCSQVPKENFERELFGWNSGRNQEAGKIELAQEGTLFLDEIEALPLAIQEKLFDFLQEGAITLPGNYRRIPICTRVIATSRGDLKDLVEQGRFSKNLYYRLNVLPIEIPPLRHRKDEIIHLAQYFLRKCNVKYRTDKTFDHEILSVLTQYQWPGNVREMEHIIERLYLTSAENAITGEELVNLLGDADISKEKIFCAEIVPLKEAKHEVEIQLVKRACREGGSTYQAAKLLKIDQSTVVKILKRHNISPL